MTVTDVPELLHELGRLCDRLPVPQESWHPYVPLIRACRADLERALELAAGRPEVAAMLAALVAGEATIDFDAGDSPELAAAYERLDNLPAPSGRHPYLDEILPTLEGLRLLLVALGRASRRAAPRAGASVRSSTVEPNPRSVNG